MAMTAESLRAPLLYTIDLKDGLFQQPMRPQLMKGDKRANMIIVRMTDGDKSADLTGASATGSFISPVGGSEIPLPGSVDGNEVRVMLLDECYAEDGYFEASVTLTVGETSRTILSITGHVLSKGSGAVINVGGVIPNIGDIIAQYAAMKQAVEDTNAATNRANAAAARAEALAIDASGYAGDSNKLGGKERKYFEPTINLLRNSDFTKFVAQAGIMGMHGAVQYAGDGWKMKGGTVTGVANEYGDGYTDITFQPNTRFEQIITGIEKYYGQPMTAALWLKNGSVTVGSAIVNAPTEDFQTPIIAGNDKIFIYVQASPGDARHYLFIIATYENSETVVSADLIPGAFTAETLPPHAPKGYAAELAECQRRFHVYETESARPAKPLDCCPPMELALGTTNLTQGTVEVDGKTLYFNSTDL